MTNPGGVDPNDLPDLSFGIGAGAMGNLEGRTEDSIKATLKAAKKPGIEESYGGFNNGIIGVLTRLLTGGGMGGSGPLAAGLQLLLSLVGMRWDQVDTHETDIADLQDKTQVLQDVIGYGCSYMNTTTSTDFKGTLKKMQFGTQVGPIVGCTMDGYGFVLGSKGLWRADLQMTFDVYSIGVKNFDMDIRVYAPDGTLFDQQLFPDSTGSRASRTNVFSFVVPGPGYKVYAYAQCALGRGMLGGNGRSGFYVTKISGETN